MLPVVVLTSVSLISPVPEPAGLFIPGYTGLVHSNVAPAVGLVALKVKGWPLQTVGVVGMVVVRNGGCVTVTVTSWLEEHPLAVRV